MSNFTFGGRAIPGSGVTMTPLDLNDKSAWTTLEFIPKPSITIDTARQNWRGQSSRLGGDRSPLSLDVKFVFNEQAAGHVFALDQAKISQAGEQWLTLNATQQVLAEYLDLQPTLLRPGSVAAGNGKVYGGTLSFLARKGYAEDISATSFGPQALGGSTGAGTQTNFTITPAGSVLTRPVFTIDIPITNTVTITQIKLQNTLSGEILTLNFSPALAASTHWVITIDTDAYTIKDASNTNYDPVGSFPKLYPPAGTGNTFTATVVTGSGTSTGVALSASYTNHWEVQS